MNSKTLDTRCKDFNIVLNIPHSLSESTFNQRILQMYDKLSLNGFYYAAIIHDKDIDYNGFSKVKHLHLVLIGHSRIRISTLLYRLADYLSYGEDLNLINTIQIDKCDNVSTCVQYLTHKNDSTKYQYDYDCIVSNLRADVLLDYYKQLKEESVTTLSLIRMIHEEKLSDLEIMLRIGASRFNLYKTCIFTIRQQFKDYVGTRQREIRIVKVKECDTE